MATCKRFHEYCNHHGIALPKRNFTASYDTNIPRQVRDAPSYVRVGCEMLRWMVGCEACVRSAQVLQAIAPAAAFTGCALNRLA